MIFDFKEEKWHRALDRALGTWESVVEWADYISFLARLQKAVKFGLSKDKGEMPEQSRVAEMLARCLDPSLPSGVHQKAVDVYGTVLDVLSDEQLIQETSIWLPGLLPLVSFAAFNVKPLVLKEIRRIVERVPSENLKELCQPIQLSCLPSLEESECFVEITDLLSLLAERLGDESFWWQSLWICIIREPGVRQGSLNWIQRRLTGVVAPTDPAAQPDVGLFIRALVAALEDTNVLVQRSCLDMLLTNVPLSSPLATSKVGEVDRQLLMRAALLTISRKDMSLNRRLWVWLLGPDPDPDAADDSEATVTLSRSDYFARYACKDVIQTLLNMLPEPNAFVIARGLMDRWELGSQVAPRLLVPTLRLCIQNPDLVKFAASFVNSVESNIMWKTALDLIKEGDTSTVVLCDYFDVSDAEMQSLYVPLVFLWCLQSRQKSLKVVESRLVRLIAPLTPPSSFKELTNEQIESWFEQSVAANVDSYEAPAPPISYSALSNALLNAAGDDPELIIPLLDKLPPGALHALRPLVSRWSNKCSICAPLLIRLHSLLAPSDVAKSVRALVATVVERLETTGERQVESLRELWSVHEAVRGSLVESSLARHIASTSTEKAARLWSVLWTHSIERSDFSELLTKPTLLILDKFPDNSTARMAIDAVVCRTGTSSKLAGLVVSRFCAESLDRGLVSYHLSLIDRLLAVPEIAKAILQRYWKQIATVLLEVASRGDPPSSLFEVAKHACTHPLLPDGDVWLIRLVELISGTASTSTPTEILFCAAVAPHISSRAGELLMVLAENVPVVSDWDCICYARLMDACVAHTSSSGVSMIDILMRRLDIVEPEIIDVQNLEDVHDISSLVQLAGCLEHVLHASAAQTASSGSGSSTVVEKETVSTIGSVLGFSVESPNDRSAQAEARNAFSHAAEASVARCCSWWKFIERVRIVATADDSATTTLATALHAQGRLKTRVRKILAQVYTEQPGDVLSWIAKYLDYDFEAATRLAHMFGGSPLTDMPAQLDDTKKFAFVEAWVRSLELDVLEDAWPALSSFLSGTKLINPIIGFLPGFEKRLVKARLTQRRRIRKEYTELVQKTVSQALSDGGSVSTENWCALLDITDVVGDALLSKMLAQVIIPGLPSQILTLAKFVKKVAAKIWRSPVEETIFDSHIFNWSVDDADAFRPVVQAWLIADKERAAEFLNKIASYGSNAVLFGWSGSQELAAENLIRAAYLVICGGTALPISWLKLLNQLGSLWTAGNLKVLTMLRAVEFSAPTDSATAFTAFRLRAVLEEALRGTVDNARLLEVCRTLDLSLAVGGTTFQLYAWLFVADSTDAIYKSQPSDIKGSGRLIDRLAYANLPLAPSTSELELRISKEHGVRPILPPRAGFEHIAAFFSSLSITLYEEKYRLAEFDTDYTRRWLLADLFTGPL